MEKEIITAVAIGLGLAASCGFRVFVPMLVASIAALLILLIIYFIMKFGEKIFKRKAV